MNTDWFSNLYDLPKMLVAQLYTTVTPADVLVQATLIACALIVGILLGRLLGNRLRKRFPVLKSPQTVLVRFCASGVAQMPALCALIIIWLGSIALYNIQRDIFITTIAANLLVAWVVIRLVASFLLDRFWSQAVAAIVWSLAALNIMGILGPALQFLDGFGLTIGSVRLTVLAVLKTAVIVLVLLKTCTLLCAVLDRKLQQIPDIAPSTHVLLSKTLKITLVIVVGFVALNSVGLDLTALTVFSGAVGVGIGFGLQKVVGNFISGIILLLDRSIKPGDVIQIGDMYGWIINLHGRYVSINTRDGREVLIPNEDLITGQVINWSYSNPYVRLKVPVGISYKNDPHEAMKVLLKSVEGVERVLTDPAPKCLLAGFGDSSVDLELRFWISDPQNGVNSVRSAVMLNIWDGLKAAGIEIPFPQRDVHLHQQKGE